MERLAERFFCVADANPTKKAIWCDGEEMTYAELESLVCKYANYLKSHGVQYCDSIGIPMNNSIESVALFFAAAVLGVTVVPINPTMPYDVVEGLFLAGKVKHLIARRSFYMSIKDHNTSYLTGLKLCLDGEIEGTDSFAEVLGQSDEKPSMEGITGAEPLILTMTSGSTGDPKPIVLTQKNKLDRAIAHIDLYHISSEDVILASTPLYHSLAERLVILPLILGATSILLPRYTAMKWLQCVKEQSVTFTIAVSAQLGQITQLLSSPYSPEISSLRAIVSSSALLESHVRNELIHRLKCDFYEMYGTSECSTVTSINFHESMEKINSVGRPLPGVEIRVIDSDGVLLDNEEIGEITVRSPLMCEGYYEQADKWENAMHEGFFKTGDLGRVDGDGYLYFEGRKKELIITGGVNVYPKDIESKLLMLDEVSECAAFPYSDERLGEVVAVAIVLAAGAQLSKRKVQAYCAGALADFQQPHKVFFLEKLPTNGMGKIVKRLLPEAVAGMEG